MRYILTNISTPNDAIVNKYFNLRILQDAAYNSRTKNAINKTIEYSYVMIPILQISDNVKLSMSYRNHLNHFTNLLRGKVSYEIVQANEDVIYSIGYFLEKNLQPGEIACLERIQFYMTLVTEIGDNDFTVFYTDGSASQTRCGGYCCVKIADEAPKENEEAALEPFTGRLKSSTIFAGSIADATNNIAELSAVKAAIENKSDKLYQVIIADSDLCVKSFRDYIYSWRINGWKAANKKPIKNIELVQEIDGLLRNSGCIYLFKWTEAHVGNHFNEICDFWAKQKAGI